MEVFLDFLTIHLDYLKEKNYITLDGQTNTDDFVFVDGLKNNLLSVGQFKNGK